MTNIASFINISILLLHNNGSNLFIFSSSHCHHLIFNKFSICSGVNLYLINFAGFPPIKLYGDAFLTTWLLLAITTPSPIVMPDIMVTLEPIHTSLPIITSPFVDG